MPDHSASVLRAYRELLNLIKRLPTSQRDSAWMEARQAMRQHAAEADGGRQMDLHKLLLAKISFIRTVTPRRPGEVSSIGGGTFVLREGRLVEGAGTSAGSRCALLSPHAISGCVAILINRWQAISINNAPLADAGWQTARLAWRRQRRGTSSCCSGNTLGGRRRATTPRVSDCFQVAVCYVLTKGGARWH